jgi:hypothetical protein
LGALVVLVLESPATVLNLLKEPLQEQGISYGEMEGGLLSGFTLKDVNYNNQVQADEVALIVDFEALKDRVLVIESLVLLEAKIDKVFLTNLIDANRSDEPEKEGNLTLPFDKVLVKEAHLSLKETGYQNYYIHSAKLDIKNLETDMKKEHKGEVKLLLDSNITQANIEASFVNEAYNIFAKIEGNQDFINPFIREQNITLLLNPKIDLEAKGNLDLVNYKLNINALSLKQNSYKIKSQRFKTFGSFNIAQNSILNNIEAELDGDIAHLKLKSRATLDLDDLNNTLKFDINGEVKPKKEFIPLELAEQNISIQKLPKISILTKGTMQHLNFFTTIKGFKVKQNGIGLNLETLTLKGDANPLQGDIKSDLITKLQSSIASGDIHLKSTLNYKDINNTLKFDFNANLKSHKKFLTNIAKDANIKMSSNGIIKVKAKGDIKKVHFFTELKGFRGKQKDILFNLQYLSLKGEAKPLQGDVYIKLLSRFKSSIVNGNIDLKSQLNYKDINNTLAFNLNSNLKTHKHFLTKILKDANVTVKSDSTIKVVAKGDMNRVLFTTDIKNFRAKQNTININLPHLSLKGDSRPLQGDTHANLWAKFNSNVTDGEVDLKSKLNFKDVNNSLRFTLKSDLNVHEGYINKFLKDANVTLRGESKIVLKADGGVDKISSTLSLKSKVFAQNILSNIMLKSDKIDIDLKKSYIDGLLNLDSKAPNMRFSLKSHFFGDYSKPKEMQTKSRVIVSNFNAFDINLNSLTPLQLNINKSKTQLLATLHSKKIKLNAKSSNFDQLSFNLNVDHLYPSKIVKVPSELKDKFITLNFTGRATISQQYFNIKGFIASNKSFKANINAKNNRHGLKAYLTTKHLKLNASGDLKKKNINAKLTINSVTKVQEEFARLYPFEITPIQGRIVLKAKLQGDRVSVNLASSKLKMVEGFNLENIAIDAEYKPDLVTISRLNLETTGFKDAKLNKKIYLNRKGLIYLGKKRDILLDIHPKILVDIKGEVNHLNGLLKIDALPLGHPDYGNVILSSNINFIQNGKRKQILGDVFLKKMKIVYEAKFLDPAHDSDVIILNKKDKGKKEEENSFIQDTYIDLSIYAPDAQYKTKDIQLSFSVDLKAKKEFGKNLGMFGKVKEINGRVEQAPKLFTVVDSSIVFRGLKEINPLLDIQVQHNLPDVVIFIDIHGDANRPKLDFSSDPQMPKKDILSYLLLGVSTAKLSDKDTNLGREAELFIMNQAARDLAYELELDRVFIKDDGTGEGYAMQVGKKINENTMFVIESSKEGNSFILEYNVNKNIKIDVGQHQKTIPSQSIDIFFRKRFK